MKVRLRGADELPLVSQASYWLPDLVLELAWLEHAPIAFWLTAALRPRSVVELGVHRGFSYFAFCQTVRRLELDTHCFAVDHWIGDAHAGFYGAEVYRDVCRHNRRYADFSRRSARTSRRQPHVRQRCDRSPAYRRLPYLSGGTARFRDLAAKLSERGVVLLHDTAEYRKDFGVYLLRDELRQRIRISSSHTDMASASSVSAPSFRNRSAGCSPRPRTPRQRTPSAPAISVSAASSAACRTVRCRRWRSRSRRLEAILASYEARTSWRVTAPLRALARFARLAKGTAGAFGDTLQDAASGAARPANYELKALPSGSSPPRPRARIRRRRNTA